VEAVQQALDSLNAQFQADVNAAEGKLQPEQEQLETTSVVPKKSDIAVKLVSLVWAPYWQSGNSKPEPAW